MLSTIHLDVVVAKRRSTIELCLGKSDIKALYDEAFVGTCPVCQTEVDPPGVMCCGCFSVEMEHHKDCCLEERCP